MEKKVTAGSPISPVSYTHLDVYKRQVRNLGKKSFEEVRAKLQSLGFDLASDDDNN